MRDVLRANCATDLDLSLDSCADPLGCLRCRTRTCTGVGIEKETISDTMKSRFHIHECKQIQ